MSVFNWIEQAESLFDKYGADAITAYEALKQLYVDATSPALVIVADRDTHALHATNTGILPSLLTFQRKLLTIHAKRHMPNEIVAAAAKAGKTMTYAEADAMVQAGDVLPGPVPPIVPQSGLATEAAASTGRFANIVAFFQQLLANLPQILSEVEADIGPIMQLIAVFSTL